MSNDDFEPAVLAIHLDRPVLSTGERLRAIADYLWSVWQAMAAGIVIYSLGPALGLLATGLLYMMCIAVRRMRALAERSDMSDDENHFTRFAA
jgi:hypothetical protein